MIRINLLPFRAARKKENVRRQISVFFLSLVFILFVVVYYNMKLNSVVQRMENEKKDISAQLTKYDKINREIKTIKAKLDTLNKKIAVISELEGNRKEAVLLMDVMTKLVVPNRMWFTDLSLQQDKIAIQGVAMDERTIADFMKNLQSVFRDVTLKSLQQNTLKGQGLTLKNFSFTLIKRPLQKPSVQGAEKS